MEKLMLIGLAAIFFGFLLIMLAALLSTFSEKNVKVESAGIIMIGPIPIMFGSKRLLIPLAILAIALMVLSYMLFWKR